MTDQIPGWDEIERALRGHLMRDGIVLQADELVAIVEAYVPVVVAAERARVAGLADERGAVFREPCGVSCPDHGVHLCAPRPFSELLRGAG